VSGLAAGRSGLPAIACRLLKAAFFLCCLLPGTVVEGKDSPAVARGRIEAMSPQEKSQLSRRRERFAALEPAEQEQLRRLHRQIGDDPRAAELRRVMQRYYEWLKQLSPYARAELLELPPAQRIERIKKLKRNEDERLAKREDSDALRRWMEGYAARHEAELLKSMPPHYRQRLARLKGSDRSRAMMGLMWMRWQSGDRGKRPPLDEQELADLRSKLSPATRQQLEAMPAIQQWGTIASWIRQGLRHRAASHGFGTPPLAVSEEKLADFFENKLSPEQRDWLLGLSSEEMDWALPQMYFSHLRSPDEPIRLPTRPAWARRPSLGKLPRIRPRGSDRGPPRHMGRPGPGSRRRPNGGEREVKPAGKGQPTRPGKPRGPTS